MNAQNVSRNPKKQIAYVVEIQNIDYRLNVNTVIKKFNDCGKILWTRKMCNCDDDEPILDIAFDSMESAMLAIETFHRKPVCPKYRRRLYVYFDDILDENENSLSCDDEGVGIRLPIPETKLVPKPIHKHTIRIFKYELSGRRHTNYM